jgi:Flp pilus assembly protein TadG
MKHPSSDNERGQAIVILALMMIGLLAFAALAIDGGNAYVERRRAQNGADAAALAGARQIWIQQVAENASETDLLTVINQAAEGNGITPGSSPTNNPNVVAYYTTDADGTTINPNQIGTLGFIPPGVTGIRVNAGRNFNTFFGGFVGHTAMAASARATAIIVQPVPCGSWAIYATGNGSCNPADVEVSGGGQGIVIDKGGVYSSGSLKCDTSKATVNPPNVWEYNGSLAGQQCTSGGDNTVVQGTVAAPPTWDYNDFVPGGSVQAALGSNYHDLTGINKPTISANGLYFIDGDASHLDIADNVTHVTIVANGEIQFSGGINLSAYYNGLLLFSNAASNSGNSVKISGSDLNWQGLIYAPNGSVDMSGASNSSLAGSINALCVNGAGAEISLTYDPAACVPQRATIKLLKFGE